jgi:hypothetical protein
MNISTGDILAGLTEVLRSESSLNDDGAYVFEYLGHQLPPLEPEMIESLAEAVTLLDEAGDGSVRTHNSYEVPVQSSDWIALVRRQHITLSDPQGGISYRLDLPSDTYTVYMLLKVLESMDPRQKPMIFRRSAMTRDRILRGDMPSVFELIKSMLRVRTLMITSEAQQSWTTWKQYADAFFFQVGYNLDFSLMPDRNWSELLRQAKISSMRRTEYEDLDVPRRRYEPDLVYHYQLGLSAESPMLEYISYYHVAEHWFENIYEDDLVEQVRLTITSPDFSYKRKSDLRGLIKKVSKAVQLRDERLVINERVALKLTLEKYVNVLQLVSDINAFDPGLLNGYTTRTVAFCDGDKVPFDQSDLGKVFTALSSRIYKTRNALVHSKEGSKAKFTPFSDDRHLIPEVPLMRFIAEQIIISTSSIPS